MAEQNSWWAGPSGQGQGQSQPQSSGPQDFRPNTMEPPEADEEKLLTRRIHILGMGSIGTLIAHSLRTIPHPPPITIMMHKQSMYDTFRRCGSVIRLMDVKAELNDPQRGYDCDVRQPWEPGQPPPAWHYKGYWKEGTNTPAYSRSEDEILPETGETFIYTLICTVKAQHSVAAMKSIRHRVDQRTTICLMQNGLGQIDELIDQVFTDPATRPTFLIGVISHGCYMTGPVTVHHTGFGATSLGIHRDTDRYPLPPKSLQQTTSLSSLSTEDRARHYPTDAELYATSLSARYLLRTLTRTSTLAAAAYPYLDLLQLQLEKLSANALLNPLTALYDLPNGFMLQNTPLSTVQNMLLAELSLVIRSLPELQTIPALNARFSSARLKDLFVGVATKTAKNSSSMREDVRKAKLDTEIDYINGYIVKRGQEVGVQAVLNFMVCQMVKAKVLFGVQKGIDEIPFAGGIVEATTVREPDIIAGSGGRTRGKQGEDGSGGQGAEPVILEDLSGEPRWHPGKFEP
jgi:2-dehydropantoate 2-reductase